MDGVFSAHASCDGSNSAIISALECEVPMNDLVNAPYSLSLGDLIVAKVRALNTIGWSEFSSENTSGATVATKPTFMNDP